MVSSVLVLDRDQKDLEACQRNLISLGYHPIITPDAENACQILNSEHPALLLTDILSLVESGPKLFHSAHDVHPQVPIVILTGMATIDTAVQTLKEGAQFYLLKPVNFDYLKAALERIIPPSRPAASQPESGPQPQNTAGEIIVGASRAIREVLDVAGRVAHSEANIVLFGESGTGKELFARTIHACSNRAQGPFIPVDCASLPENLLEGELFGFEKGAFTGAIHAKPGLMELSHLGTLFFDEVAELPLSLQPKLLRALQERQHRRLGGIKMIGFDVRVIAATNRDLGQLVVEGKFRQDLFYRLNVVPIHLPPLRKRENDAILLANHLLAEHRRKNPTAPQYFAPAVLRLFEQYSWPGNVRELQNVVAYCCALARTETISIDDLPEELQLYNPKAVELSASSPLQTFKAAKAQCLAEFETAYIAELLTRYGDNITQAARAAGIDRKTFYALLQKHQLRRSAIEVVRKPSHAS
jgi:two-component system, NtrC family, response regulator HydG